MTTSELRIGSLFSGVGGLELGVTAAVGGDVVWQSEIDGTACRVLDARFPGVPNIGDITTAVPRMEKMMTNDEAARRRLALYRGGMSLAEVAKSEGVSRQTVWKQLNRRGFDLRSGPLPLPHVEFNGRRYTQGVNGYYRRTTDERQYLHRDVWEHAHGSLAADWDVHHIDHDRTNNELANLEAMPKSEHTRRHYEEAKHGKEGDPGTPEPIDLLVGGYP